MESQEYRDGIDAFSAGKPIEANPYEKSDWNGSYNDWNRGWRDMEQQEREDQDTREGRYISPPPVRESYALGCDARNDLRPIDENPYRPDRSPEEWRDFDDWAQGWADADRALERLEYEGE